MISIVINSMGMEIFTSNYSKYKFSPFVLLCVYYFYFKHYVPVFSYTHSLPIPIPFSLNFMIHVYKIEKTFHKLFAKIFRKKNSNDRNNFVTVLKTFNSLTFT